MKNHSNTFLLTLFIAFAIVFQSCQTYEDGPTISLKSKTARVENKWKPAIVSRNDLNETDQYLKYTLDFGEDGSFSWMRQRLLDSTTTEIKGQWSLSSANRQIKLRYEVPFDSVSFTERLLYMDIQRLKEDELWLNYFDDEDCHGLRLIPR